MSSRLTLVLVWGLNVILVASNLINTGVLTKRNTTRININDNNNSNNINNSNSRNNSSSNISNSRSDIIRNSNSNNNNSSNIIRNSNSNNNDGSNSKNSTIAIIMKSPETVKRNDTSVIEPLVLIRKLMKNTTNKTNTINNNNPKGKNTTNKTINNIKPKGKNSSENIYEEVSNIGDTGLIVSNMSATLVNGSVAVGNNTSLAEDDCINVDGSPCSLSELASSIVGFGYIPGILFLYVCCRYFPVLLGCCQKAIDEK